MTSTLKNHPIWQTLSQTLKQLDANQIAVQHLQACNAQINGYWDEDEFYEVISFTQLPQPELKPELKSSSWRILALLIQGMNRWLKPMNPRLEFCKIMPSFSNAGILSNSHENTHWLQLKFALIINLASDSESSCTAAQTTIGDLILILDENLEVVDENWLIDVHSPYVLTNPGPITNCG